MQVYQSPYLQINLYLEDSLIELIWLPATLDITTEEYKHEHVELLKVVLEHKIAKVLANTKDLGVVITPEVQEWMNENIFLPAMENGFNKIAIIVSTEFFTQLSIEQAMEEEVGQKIKTGYFDNREDAKEWILKE